MHRACCILTTALSAKSNTVSMRITKRQLRRIIREAVSQNHVIREGSSYEMKDGVIRELLPGGYVRVMEPLGHEAHVEDAFGRVIGYTGKVRTGGLRDAVDQIIRDHESMSYMTEATDVNEPIVFIDGYDDDSLLNDEDQAFIQIDVDLSASGLKASGMSVEIPYTLFYGTASEVYLDDSLRKRHFRVDISGAPPSYNDPGSEVEAEIGMISLPSELEPYRDEIDDRVAEFVHDNSNYLYDFVGEMFDRDRY